MVQACSTVIGAQSNKGRDLGRADYTNQGVLMTLQNLQRHFHSSKTIIHYLGRVCSYIAYSKYFTNTNLSKSSNATSRSVFYLEHQKLFLDTSEVFPPHSLLL